MRILIAEDDQVLADGLLRALRSAGAAVDHVASGSEADAVSGTSDDSHRAGGESGMLIHDMSPQCGLIMALK